jgi:transcriptional regulator with XRE-family HTH domain
MTAIAGRKKTDGRRAQKPRKPHPNKKPLARKAVAKPTAPAVAGNLREKLGLTQPEFAGLLPVSVRTLATLEKGTTPTVPVARRLTELERLTKALSEVIRESAIGEWLKTPNPAFGGLKPLEVIDRGESDQLWEMIYFLRSGVAS